MSRARTFAALLVALGGALGCSAYPTIKSVPIDCTADEAYTFDAVDPGTAFTYGDPTPGSTITAASTMLPDGPRCTSTSALLITSMRHNDWGSATGFYGFTNVATGYRDDSAYQGMAFWGRAPGATGKSFTIVVDDFNTYDPTPLPPGSANPADDPVPGDSNCVSYSRPDGGVQSNGSPAQDPATGMAISSGTTTVTPPNACGNGYQVVMTLTSDWRFYTIPFAQFQQMNMSNRVPSVALKEVGPVMGTTLLTNKLMLLTLRLPREVETDLWLDKLGFYRKTGSTAGRDGGADAR